VSATKLGQVPTELKRLRRWITWRYKSRPGGKWTKKPSPSFGRPLEWLSFSEACSELSRGNADGIGFILGDGIAGIDLDDCIGGDGPLHEIARDAIGLGSYAERSPSGHGLRVFIQASIPSCRNIAPRNGVPRHEIYDGRKAHYLTATGDRLGDATLIAEGPRAQMALDAFVVKWFPEQRQAVGLGRGDKAYKEQQLDDDGLLQVMFGAKDGMKWRRVFDGDHSAYGSQSEADFALCRKLRFYTRCDAKQMGRLFRRSGLMRPKWDEQHGAQSYGELTITNTIRKGGPLYIPRDHSGKAERRDAWERKAWAKIPVWVFVRLGGVGELACRVYGVIANYADKKGEAWPTIETIAMHCRVMPRPVKTALKKLKAAGLIASTRQPGTSNLYRLAKEVPETITPFVVRRGASRVIESGHSGCSPHGTITNQEKTIIDTERSLVTLKRCETKHGQQEGQAGQAPIPLYASDAR
jgi:hypothetical protein